MSSNRRSTNGGFVTPEQFYMNQKLQKLRDSKHRVLSRRFDLSVFAIRDLVREEEIEMVGDRRPSKRMSDGHELTGKLKERWQKRLDEKKIPTRVEEDSDEESEPEKATTSKAPAVEAADSDSEPEVEEAAAESEGEESEVAEESSEKDVAESEAEESAEEDNVDEDVVEASTKPAKQSMLQKVASKGSGLLRGMSGKSLKDTTESPQRSSVAEKAVSMIKRMSGTSDDKALLADVAMQDMIEKSGAISSTGLDECATRLHKAIKKKKLTLTADIGVEFMEKVLTEELIQQDKYIPGLVNCLSAISYTSHAKVLLQAMTLIRKVISVRGQPHNATVVSSGIVPRMLTILSDTDDKEISFQICWGLTNLARGTHDDTSCVVESGGIPVMLDLLKSAEVHIRHQAAWCIGNIAADCVEYREQALDAGALPAVISFLKEVGGFSSKPQSVNLAKVRTGAWVLYNLTKRKSVIPWTTVEPASAPAAKLLRSNDEDILINSCWTIANLSDKDEEHIRVVVPPKVLERLVELLEHENSKVLTPVIKALGYYVSAGARLNQEAIDAGILPRIQKLMHGPSGIVAEPNRDTSKLALWILANMALGTGQQVKALFESGVIEDLLNIIKENQDTNDKALISLLTEGAWVLCNTTRRGNSEEIRTLVERDYMQVISWGLKRKQSKTLMIYSLKGLWCILAMGSRNRRCTCNEYFQTVADSGVESLVRNIMDVVTEERVSRWCEAISRMFDNSKMAFTKANKISKAQPIHHWSPSVHQFYCFDFKVASHTFLLCVTHHRRILQEAGVVDSKIDGKNLSFMGKIPPKVALMVFEMCTNGWFCDPKLLLN